MSSHQFQKRSDSGCSYHIMGDESIFSDMDKTVTLQVKMWRSALRNRKATVETKQKDEQSLFKKFYLCSTYSKNLLPVSLLVKHRCSVPFENDAVTGKSGKIIENVKMEKNRSLIIEVSPLCLIIQQCGSQSSKFWSSWLWHLRLGHLNFYSLKVLYQKI